MYAIRLDNKKEVEGEYNLHTSRPAIYKIAIEEVVQVRRRISVGANNVNEVLELTMYVADNHQPSLTLRQIDVLNRASIL
mmetsp:Transcript_25876/g.72456  ORF Transcript_25876/g.72456 Transcript_25876/m.72456 type:complete len:80 (-) Transcript_25876:412-651(-)